MGLTQANKVLREYGMNLGTAFQLVDDLLDFTATDEALGKPAGVDLLEGKLTLPLIYLLASETTQARAAVKTIMHEGNYEKVSRAELLSAVERTGALERPGSAPRNMPKPRAVRSNHCPIKIL